jgi:hypothetical protein
VFFTKSQSAATEHASLAEAAKLPEVGDVGGSAHDGEKMPFARHALERVSAAVFEFES